MSDLSNYRKSYEKSELMEGQIPNDPMELFRNWFFEVDNHFNEEEVNAMSLSTIGLDGFPRTRIVLLKKFTYEGFIFYTNYESEKGKAISNNNHVCLSFFWPKAERQVIVKGKAEKIAANLSDGYFESRPLGSKLGAIASHQSDVLESREVLEKKMEELEKVYEDKEIPRPDYWGGYLVVPQEIEFWQGRPNRLHDRFRFTLSSDYNWIIQRLSP